MALTLVYRGRHDGEEEVVPCYEAADCGERIAGVESGGTGEARLGYIGRICGVARGLQLNPRFRKVMQLRKCHGIG